MSTIKVTTLQNLSGVEVYTAKAWLRYNQVTPAVDASGNVSSVTDNSLGNFTVTYTTAHPSANYSLVGGHSNSSATTTAFTMRAIDTTTTTTNCVDSIVSASSAAYYDSDRVMLSVHI